jgi:hypothetical protein
MLGPPPVVRRGRAKQLEPTKFKEKPDSRS